MEIRETRLEDAVGIAKVQVDSWRTTYKGIVPESFLNSMHYDLYENRFKEYFIEKDPISFVAIDSNRHIVGFIAGGENRLRDTYTEYDCELHTIYIIKDYQRNQIGSKMIKRLVESLIKQNHHKMIVQVLAENSAKTFYEKTGAKYLGSSTISITEKELEESIYGWDNIKQLSNNH